MQGIKNQAHENAEWRAECDMRTLIDADEIRKDAKRLKAAQEMARKKLEAAASVMGEKPAT